MTVEYELWDLRSRNIINTYTSEPTLLDDVARLLRSNGEAYAHEMVYGWFDTDDEEAGGQIATGDEILRRVRTQAAADS